MSIQFKNVKFRPFTPGAHPFKGFYVMFGDTNPTRVGMMRYDPEENEWPFICRPEFENLIDWTEGYEISVEFYKFLEKEGSASVRP